MPRSVVQMSVELKGKAGQLGTVSRKLACQNRSVIQREHKARTRMEAFERQKNKLEKANLDLKQHLADLRKPVALDGSRK